MDARSEWIPGLGRLRESAYRELVERFSDPLWRFFVAAHFDPERAEEQVADTFARLVDAFGVREVRPDSLPAFVFGVARNVLRKDWARIRNARLGDGEIERIVDPGPGPERTAGSRLELARALRVVEALESPAREVMLLRFVEELSLAEIAEALDLPLGTVKSHIHRSRATLREREDRREGGTR